ncbi:MAG: hypothetical protein ABJH04_10065 [Cyclobacteriaceae bacterium]
MANKKISDKAKEGLQPFLNSYTQMLLDGLVEDEIIHKIKNPKNDQETAYELVKGVREKVSIDELPQQDNKLIKSFLEFREVVINVYYNLKYEHSDDVRKVPLSTLIEKFESMGVLSMSDSSKSRLKDILDKGERLLDDQEIEKDAITLFKEHNLNFSSYINRLLEFYAREKARQFFNAFAFDSEVILESMERRRAIDLVGKNESGPDLIFEMKYRKRTLSTLKETLFQGYEYLTRYDNESGKSNYLILLTFTEEDASTFEKAHYRFKQNIEELFPEYVKRIFFIPVSTKYLHLIEDEFKKLDIQLWDSRVDTLKFSDKPKTITTKDEVTIDANFLRQPQGSFATWVKLNPVQEYYSKPMNFEYIVAHASYNYKAMNGQYQNVFSVSLAPNHTNNTGKNPTELNWRVWIANADRKSSYLNGRPLSNEKEQWYHLLVRWNHSLPRMEFLIDGKLAEGNSEYRNFWPNEILDRAFLGTWGNKANIHYIKLPLYRLISSSQFLNDAWVKAEIKNKPND